MSYNQIEAISILLPECKDRTGSKNIPIDIHKFEPETVIYVMTLTILEL